VPVGVVALVAIVNVLEQSGVQEEGENKAVAPAGSPDAVKETNCEVPETSVAAIVLEPDEPWVTVISPVLVRK
jgi:hypothetical protein